MTRKSELEILDDIATTTLSVNQLETPPTILIVTPSLDREGRRACSNRGQLFDGTVGGRTVVSRSTQPLLDAARILAAEGIDPATPIVMRHGDSTVDALRATVGVAAGLTVGEGDKAPFLRRWEPSPHAREGAPSDFQEGAATPLASDAESAPRSEFGGN